MTQKWKFNLEVISVGNTKCYRSACIMLAWLPTVVWIGFDIVKNTDLKQQVRSYACLVCVCVCVYGKNKRTTSRIPTWSPTVVLTGPGNAWLRWADGKRYSHCCMVVPANMCHLQYTNTLYFYTYTTTQRHLQLHFAQQYIWYIIYMHIVYLHTSLSSHKEEARLLLCRTYCTP